MRTSARPADRAQAESMVLLKRPADGPAALPLRPGLKLYVEGWSADEAARLGEVVSDPADADVAVVRLAAPFDPRDDLFLEAFFHQGSLAYRPGLVARLTEIARTTPLIISADLERPALLAAFADVAAVIVTDVGASAAALADVLSGAVAPLGRLPFEVPRSAAAVRRSRPDVANDTEDPVYPAGAGLEL